VTSDKGKMEIGNQRSEESKEKLKTEIRKAEMLNARTVES
jgi:hypothetical protein